MEGVNYYDIIRRIAADLKLEQDKDREQNVEIRECLGHRFFFRPHRQLVELLLALGFIKTEQQLRKYLNANPDVLRGLDLKLNDRGGPF